MNSLENKTFAITGEPGRLILQHDKLSKPYILDENTRHIPYFLRYPHSNWYWNNQDWGRLFGSMMLRYLPEDLVRTRFKSLTEPPDRILGWIVAFMFQLPPGTPVYWTVTLSNFLPRIAGYEDQVNEYVPLLLPNLNKPYSLASLVALHTLPNYKGPYTEFSNSEWMPSDLHKLWKPVCEIVRDTQLANYETSWITDVLDTIDRLPRYHTININTDHLYNIIHHAVSWRLCNAIPTHI